MFYDVIGDFFRRLVHAVMDPVFNNADRATDGIVTVPFLLPPGLPLAYSTILMSISHMFKNQILEEYGSVGVSANGVAEAELCIRWNRIMAK